MTGNVQAPTIKAPTTQISRPRTNTFQETNYGYTPKQFSATPLTGPVLVDRPQGYPYGPTLMDKPVQGYQAPMRAVDYSYKPQYTPARQIPQPQWAIPQYPAPAMGMPGYNYQIGDIDYSPKGQIYNEDGQQIGGPRFNSDGMYIGTWESGLSDGT